MSGEARVTQQAVEAALSWASPRVAVTQQGAEAALTWADPRVAVTQQYVEASFVLTRSDWPETIPAPLYAGLKCTPGTNLMTRRTQDGRTELRRFGANAPDQWTLTWRLTPTEHDALIAYYEDDLDMGTAWFWPEWIVQLGYGVEHQARILGYPVEDVQRWNDGDSGLADVRATLIVMRQS